MLQAEKPTKVSTLWFNGICDELYQKIAVWDAAYWHGDVHSTRDWLDPRAGKPVPKPVKMAHFIPFREVELDHLVRIVEDIRPASTMLEEVKGLQKLWKSGKPVVGTRYSRSYWSKVPLPKGIHRVLTVVFYPEHVKELLGILVEAKTGHKADNFILEQKQAGKDLFEQ